MSDVLNNSSQLIDLKSTQDLLVYVYLADFDIG